jgi:hypothetical protein
MLLAIIAMYVGGCAKENDAAVAVTQGQHGGCPEGVVVATWNGDV